MYRTLLKAKLHQARVSRVELEYEGSIAIDGALLRAADIREYEQVQVYNLGNGERFTTYAIRAAEGSGLISVNGAAAHKARQGDRIIVCSYAVLSQEELSEFSPTLVYLDADNRILRIGNRIAEQAA